MKTDRRGFLKDSTKLATGLGLASLTGSAYGFDFSKQDASVKTANEMIRVGLIGCRGMGWSNLSSMLTHENVSCIALCDVDDNVLNAKSAELEQKTGKKP